MATAFPRERATISYRVVHLAIVAACGVMRESRSVHATDKISMPDLAYAEASAARRCLRQVLGQEDKAVYPKAEHSGRSCVGSHFG